MEDTPLSRLEHVAYDQSISPKINHARDTGGAKTHTHIHTNIHTRTYTLRTHTHTNTPFPGCSRNQPNAQDTSSNHK